MPRKRIKARDKLIKSRKRDKLIKGLPFPSGELNPGFSGGKGEFSLIDQ